MMDNIILFIFSIPIILITITIHEYTHGKVAQYFGDPTAEMSGRLSLNPIVHIDPVGLLMLILFRFGWAKPVPINPNYFKDPEKDMAFVGLAGPIVNFFAAWVCSLIVKFVPVLPGEFGQVIVYLLKYAIWLNIALGIFNLIPIPPLDGSRILRAVLPFEAQITMDRMEPYGFLMLVMLLIFPGTSELIMYLVNFFFNLLV